eukprot:gene31213-6362_t
MEVVVPSARGVLLSIVRDPATKMQSACNFYKCCPFDYNNSTVWDSYVLSDRGKNFFFGTHGMCSLDKSSREIVGSGLDPAKPFEGNFEEVIHRVRSGKFLVLVMERMLESMLAFADVYQPHPLDLAFLSKKIQPRTGKDTTSVQAAEAWRLMREWNPFDVQLHGAANAALDEKMKAMFPNAGAKEKALLQLASLNQVLYSVCSHKVVSFRELAEWCQDKLLDNALRNLMEWKQFARGGTVTALVAHACVN